MGVVSLSASATATASIQFQSQQQSPPPLQRGVFSTTRGSGGGGGGAFSISTWTQICFPQQRLSCFEVKSVELSSVDELQDFRVVPPTVLMAEKEEAKVVLTVFLKKVIGLSNEAAAATISKSISFIDHLVARLRSIDKTPVSRRELSILDIKDGLIPYLEYLCEEHGDSLVEFMENFLNPPEEEHDDHSDIIDDVVENFPNSPEKQRERHIFAASPTNLPLNSKKLKAITRVAEIGPDGQLPLNTLYLIDIGLDLDQIKQMACKCPSIIRPSWGRKIKPLVEFLLDIGVPPSNITKILYKQPRLSDMSLSENIIPSLAFFETLGLDKSKWAKVIHQCPHLLTHSRQKVEATVDYLYELGLPRDRIGKVLVRCPQIMNYNIDDSLRPKAEYFQSLGVNLTPLLSLYPEVFGRSIERQLKPVTEFLLDKGFGIDEIGTMASRYGFIYKFSLTNNLIPKWDFFLTMNYPRSELVKYTNYFGYSLEGRIKPRYAQMKECGVKLSMSKFLSTSDSDFLKILNRMKMKKMLEAQQVSMAVTSVEDEENARTITTNKVIVDRTTLPE